MTPETIRAVLAMHPDRPGVGRLAQEALSHMTGIPIAGSVEESVKLAHRQPRRKAFNVGGVRP